MLKFYKEKNGAFLVVETDTLSYYRSNFSLDAFEGRACASRSPIPSYVNTTTISTKYLKGCKPVSESEVPNEWLEYLI